MKPYKVVCNDTDPAWLEHRHRYVTASAVAVLFNESKWSNRSQLLAEKSSSEPTVLTDTPNMWHGRMDDAHNMRKFCDALGFRYRQAHTMVESTQCEGLACTLDGLVINNPNKFPEPLISKDFKSWGYSLKEDVNLMSGIGVLEMKQTEAWWHKDWKDVPPAYYELQVQTQLYVTGLSWGVLACQIGAAMFKAFLIEADPDVHREIEVKVKEFWNEVALGKD